jgi:hypothetical protein
MTDDLLARAARALREETAGDDASARFTRSRIMASVHEERVKRRTRWAFLIPIAATFIAASAYGAATGKTRAALLVITRALGIHRSEEPAPRPAARRRTASSAAQPALPAPSAPEAAPPEPSASEALPAEPAPEPTADVSAGLAPKPTRVQAVDAPGFSAAAPSRSLPDAGDAATDPSFELYRVAHRAHFVDRDYSRALSAWDAYLKAAPNGALVPEARYNRALCFVRLHRNDEARAALKPFAEGRYGTYRREDAQKLIDALPEGPAGP